MHHRDPQLRHLAWNELLAHGDIMSRCAASGSAGAVSITAQGSIGYSEQQPLGRVVVYGVQSFSGTATVNGQSATTHHDSRSGKLIISDFSAPVTKIIDVRWG